MPIVCKELVCGETERFEEATRTCIPCNDYERAQDGGLACGPDTCKDAEKILINGTC